MASQLRWLLTSVIEYELMPIYCAINDEEVILLTKGKVCQVQRTLLEHLDMSV